MRLMKYIHERATVKASQVSSLLVMVNCEEARNRLNAAFGHDVHVSLIIIMIIFVDVKKLKATSEMHIS